jgi:Zn-dependent M28 family amino/carboxypeptidase
MLALLAACSSNDSDGSAATDDNLYALADVNTGISAENLKEHIRYLSSDELEGRAPGSRGEELTLSYLTEQYINLGLRPGNPDGTYIQAVPLAASTVTNAPSLHLASPGGSTTLKYLDDFMGWTLRQTEGEAVNNADMVFVGYGVVAPEYDWNDYKDVDVAGKVIVMLVGDPPHPDSTLFGGKAMTYYGRWTYKFEIAAEKGAAGAIVIHRTDAAGYPWAVVSNSWSGEQFDIVRSDKGMNRCPLEGWMTQEAAQRIFDDAGLDLGAAYKSAVSRDFQPVPLNTTASAKIENKRRDIRSYNVVAMIEGSDPVLKNEYVIYTAHWDHLGIGNAVDGDSIYNGALDNASGVAATLEIARVLQQRRADLKRSVLFINTTAEESGLLGAALYADAPLYPLEKTAALVNIDGLNIWGRTKDVIVVGYGFSELDGFLEASIASHDRFMKPDTEPEKGSYYRSDHFPFAKRGVPGLYADSGIEYVSRPQHWGTDVKDAYTNERYHKPQDEMDASWNLSGAIEDLEAYARVGLMIAATADFPKWSEKSEFKVIRERSMSGSK